MKILTGRLHSFQWLLMFFIVVWLLPLYANEVRANQLPPITGTVYDGEQITWDALPEAAGYNIFLEFKYIDTVIGSTMYVPTQRGEYRIAGFDNNGAHSPLQVIDVGVVPTTNIAEVFKLPGEDTDRPPGNDAQLPPVTGAQFDGSVISWDVLDGASGYNIYLDFNYLDTVVNGTTYTPLISGEYRIAGFDDEGRFSPLQVIDSNVVPTTNTVDVNLDSIDPPDNQPNPPQNLSLIVYSGTAAEIFWDRAPLSENVVSTDVFRDGELLGTSPGTSFYDDTREPGVDYGYELVAVSALGVSSDPAFINPDPLQGNPDDVAQRILAGISDVTGNNPHVVWFSTIRGLTGNNTPLELLSSERVTIDGQLRFREIYDCDTGTLTLDEIESRFGIYILEFADCSFNGALFSGGVSIVGTDIGGYNARYNGLLILSGDVDTFMTGAVSLSVGRAINFMSLFYSDFIYATVSLLDDNADSATVVELNQRLADSIFPEATTTLTTQFFVTAPWTRGRSMEVNTSEEFSGLGADNSHYLTGELSGSLANGDNFVLNADTGDAASWTFNINARGASSEVFGPWTEVNRLPCLSVAGGEDAHPGCSVR